MVHQHGPYEMNIVPCLDSNSGPFEYQTRTHDSIDRSAVGPASKLFQTMSGHEVKRGFSFLFITIYQAKLSLHNSKEKGLEQQQQ